MRGKGSRTATALLIAIAGAAWLSAQVAPVYQVVVSVDPVALDVSVTDRAGKAVASIAKEDFAVLEDGEPQEILGIEPVGMPYSILVLVDRSSRTEKSDWPQFILNSVDLFLKNLRGPDRLAVAAFDTRVAVLVDWRPSRNGNLQRVLLRESQQPTRLFEAVNWASEEMAFVASGGTPGQPGQVARRRGVIVFTDGRDMDMYPEILHIRGQDVPDPNYTVPAGVEARFQRSLEIIRSGSIPYYFVGVDTDRQLSEKAATAKLEGWVRFLAEVRTRIEQLASASGGRATFPRQIEDLYPLYQQIHRDLGSGYHITYKSGRPAEGKLRRIEVRVRDSNLQVYQSRNSYIAR